MVFAKSLRVGRYINGMKMKRMNEMKGMNGMKMLICGTLNKGKILMFDRKGKELKG